MVSLAYAAAGKHGPLTVRDAIEDYLTFLEANRRSALDARCRANAFILPVLGDLEIEELTTERLRQWHVDLAKAPPRLRTKAGTPQKHRPDRADDESRRRRRSTAN